MVTEFFFGMKQNNTRFFFLFIILFVFFNNTVVFSQSVSLEEPSEDVLMIHGSNSDIRKPETVLESKVDSNVNFILWFMGTKENFEKTAVDEVIFSKKSLMTSGRRPNHLLVKTLLKRTLNSMTS
ncbi:hypothetical protein [Flavobacterium adhaerens]|uniref:hypothetical protein n=1 Tax=Flavobacterium adhaerens TaxID=3149043 RepID=UPI0032B53913